jgi:hypothetical protein
MDVAKKRRTMMQQISEQRDQHIFFSQPRLGGGAENPMLAVRCFLSSLF